jgi:transcription antitermination factor NusG
MCWFAAKTKNRAEFKASEFFNSIGINSYVPSYKTKRIWSDRIKNVIVPAISGYVFFELNKLDYRTLNTNPFTKNIIRNISGEPAIIKDSEIKILKDQLSGANIKSVDKFEAGQQIKIQSGPFIYKKGIIGKISYNKVLVNLDSINLNLVLNKSCIVAA